VTVEVQEAAHVHEPVVLGVAQRVRAGADGFADEIVHLFTALGGQADDRLAALGRIGDLERGDEALEERLDGEHDRGVVADDHPAGVLVGELLVEREADAAEEGPGPGQILHRQVDERHSRHGRSFLFGRRRIVEAPVRHLPVRRSLRT
jgi:hypothetical protein